MVYRDSIMFENSLEYACNADAQDTLAGFRKKFLFPTDRAGAEQRYFCGNSLGLQAITTREYIIQELDDWQRFAVEGHFHAKHPWFSYHSLLTAPLARLTGALPLEVVCMNTLTANLHALMISFYRPTNERYKIFMEAGAFPSDQYAVETQVRLHGFNPIDAIIEVAPREGETTLRTDDILTKIEEHADTIALILIGGVQYATGQRFDMQAITAAGHAAGAQVGFDLAHAIGNVELSLHDWNVDFAAWCSYKYLNSGPGGVGGIFVHERHAQRPDLPRLGGWWGVEESTRFQMKKGFIPAAGAAGWQLSNAQVFQMAALRASLDMFDEAGFPALCAKRNTLTAYLEFLLKIVSAAHPNAGVRIITPENPAERGCQISFYLEKGGKEVYNRLIQRGIILDWREPNILRTAPVPLYNSFEDVFMLASILNEELGRQ